MADVSSLNNDSRLDAFTAWASTVRSDQVAGMKGDRLGDINKVSNAFQRHFMKASVSAMRNSAVESFKTALTEKFGATIADQAWKAAGGGLSTKGLTAELIQRTVGEANDLAMKLTYKLMDVAKKLAPPDMEFLDLTALSNQAADVTNLQQQNTDNKLPQALRHEAKSLTLQKQMDSLLCMTPSTKAEAAAFKARLDATMGDIDELIASDSSLSKEMEECKAALLAKEEEVNSFMDDLPGGEKALGRMADHWKSSLNAACNRLLGSLPTDAEGGLTAKGLKLEAKLCALMDKYDGDAMLSKLKSKKNEIGSALQSEIARCVRSVYPFGVPKGAAQVDGLLNQCHLDALNSADWTPIEKKFDGQLNGEKMSFVSSFKSGAHIDDSIKAQYDAGMNGYNCHTKNTANAVNLATSELTVNGETVFRGVRHGVHSAKDVKGMTNAHANIQRAKQTVMAAFAEYLKMHPELKDGKGGGTIKFNMVSTSLLTPIGLKKEDKMLAAQTKAWNAISNKEMTITVDGRSYMVQPNVLTFNYGVNKGAVHLKGEPSNGWGASGKLNKSSLPQLMTRVDEFLKGGAPEDVKNAVSKLRDQIRDIAANKLERRDSHEAYKMPSRIAVMSYLMGDVPVWNCKSGKDRTGWMDVECKFLATLIKQGQDIPEPGERLTPDQKKLFNTLLLQSGNHEMQEYNTGVAGYKLSGVDSVSERAGISGDDEAKKTFRGASGYAGS